MSTHVNALDHTATTGLTSPFKAPPPAAPPTGVAQWLCLFFAFLASPEAKLQEPVEHSIMMGCLQCSLLQVNIGFIPCILSNHAGHFNGSSAHQMADRNENDLSPCHPLFNNYLLAY